MSNIFFYILSILIVLYIIFHTIKNFVFANKLQKRNLSNENINTETNYSVRYKYDFSLLERPAFLRRMDFWDKDLFPCVINAMNENEFKLLLKTIKAVDNSNKISNQVEMIRYFKYLDKDRNQELINNAKSIIDKTFANASSYAMRVSASYQM